MTPGQASERSGDWGAEVFKCPECRSLEAQIVELKRSSEDALLIAHEFVDSVTAWNGTEDDCQETLQAIDDALAALSTDQPSTQGCGCVEWRRAEGCVKPRLLDLFCGAGGAAMGYSRAGFEVVGVDHVAQPNYPFEFVQDDALDLMSTYPWWDVEPFDAIHASPPCQAYTTLRSLQDKDYPDLIGATRHLLNHSGVPFVIENVVGAPLFNPVMLCGSSFGLRIRRHRLFECHGFDVMALPCAHHWQQDKIFPALNGEDRKRGGRSGIVGVYGNGGDKRADLWAKEMGIDWMTRQELTQAIPPAFTEHIGAALLTALRHREAA